MLLLSKMNFMKNRLFIFLLLSLLVFAFKPNEPLRVFLVGDSTMANKLPADYPETGWGIPFAGLFNEAVEVQNHAYNGRSTKSFRTEGRWAKVFDQIKPGDYVFIQFGHNDAKLSDTSRYAAAQTDYRKNLTRYIQETRSKGGIPVILSSIQRRKFDSTGHFVDQHGDYPKVAKEVAFKEKAIFIDMEAKSRALIEKLGPVASEKIFLHLPTNTAYKKYKKGVADDTHFTYYGASVMANLVAQAIEESTEHLKSFLKKSDFNAKYQYEIPVVSKPVFKLDTFDIQKFGAKNDLSFNNAVAIQQAINECSNQGGGTVLIAKGFWRTGPIELKSNVNLHLAAGALLQFSEQSFDYPLVKTFWEGVEAIRVKSPISGKNLRKIAITGTGIIDGAGEAWRPVKKQKLTVGEWEKLIQNGVLNEKKDTWYPTAAALKGAADPNAGRTDAGYTLANTAQIKEFLRPNLLSLIECDEVLLEDFTIQNSPAWTVHPLLCTHVTLQGLVVKNPWYAQNSDGLDIESCEYVNVNNCKIDVGDDGICLKSGKDEQGRKRGRPTAFVNISNSTVFHGHGGIVIGSEMSGGVHDIFAQNCQFLGTDVGLRFKTARGRGGIVEKVYIKDISMNNIAGEAIILDMYYQGKDPVATFGNGSETPQIKSEPVTDGTPQFQNIFMENVVAQNAKTGLMVRGLPEMTIKNIQLVDSQLSADQAYHIQFAENLLLKSVKFLQTSKQENVFQFNKGVKKP
ncbi:GDSL family lipase [Sandaracinomonas limnophila]|uniref:GDSL family lipase n=2 Tax=Sandaracinomonas limnophila TaxID=1862386 RepID=A0A437PTU7_9BACT|nr:GDSL family lipase [Sandaracinomonas limnophila]